MSYNKPVRQNSSPTLSGTQLTPTDKPPTLIPCAYPRRRPLQPRRRIGLLRRRPAPAAAGLLPAAGTRVPTAAAARLLSPAATAHVLPTAAAGISPATAVQQRSRKPLFGRWSRWYLRRYHGCMRLLLLLGHLVLEFCSGFYIHCARGLSRWLLVGVYECSDFTTCFCKLGL